MVFDKKNNKEIIINNAINMGINGIRIQISR